MVHPYETCFRSKLKGAGISGIPAHLYQFAVHTNLRTVKGLIFQTTYIKPPPGYDMEQHDRQSLHFEGFHAQMFMVVISN